MTVNEEGEMRVKFVLGNVQDIRIEEDLGVERGPLLFGLYIACMLHMYFLKFSIRHGSDFYCW
jgi:hypothetical protein